MKSHKDLNGESTLTSKYRVSVLDTVDVVPATRFEMNISISFSDIVDQIRDKHEIKIGDYNITSSHYSGELTFKINGYEIPDIFYGDQIIFYPHEVVVTNKNQTKQFINPHIQNPLKGNDYVERKAEIIASNETILAYVENGKLYKKLLKDNETTPEEIALPTGMKIVKPLIVTHSGNIIYGMEKSGITELYLNGEKIGDIPEFIELQYIKTTLDTCIIIVILPNGLSKKYSIDATLSASRPGGTEQRVILAREATSRVLGSNKVLNDKIGEKSSEISSLKQENSNLNDENVRLRRDLIASQDRVSELERSIKELTLRAKIKSDNDVMMINESAIAIKGLTAQIKEIDALLHDTPVPTGMLGKSVPEKEFRAYIAQLLGILK